MLSGQTEAMVQLDEKYIEGIVSPVSLPTIVSPQISFW